ncbi:PTS lactose/cellobiose transporter subunit IIA [Selenomonas bovis]
MSRNGKKSSGVDIGFLTVHAQDHLMTAMPLSDMDKRFLKILRKKAGK